MYPSNLCGHKEKEKKRKKEQKQDCILVPPPSGEQLSFHTSVWVWFPSFLNNVGWLRHQLRKQRSVGKYLGYFLSREGLSPSLPLPRHHSSQEGHFHGSKNNTPNPHGSKNNTPNPKKFNDTNRTIIISQTTLFLGHIHTYTHTLSLDRRGPTRIIAPRPLGGGCVWWWVFFMLVRSILSREKGG